MHHMCNSRPIYAHAKNMAKQTKTKSIFDFCANIKKNSMWPCKTNNEMNTNLAMQPAFFFNLRSNRLLLQKESSFFQIYAQIYA